MKIYFLTCVAILFISSQLYAQSEDELIAKFNETNKKFSQMMIDNDLEGMLSYYAENPISMPSYQPMLRSLDAMRESHKQQHEKMGMKVTAFKLTATDVILEGNIAVEIGTYTISMDMPEMGSIDDYGKYMNVWQKQDGDWKLRADMWNTDMNPWMKMEGEHDDYGKDEETDKDE